MRIAPNQTVRVGRSFPGEGSERNPAERNDVTRRNVRVRAEPRIRDRIQRGQDWDPTMPALRLRPPWKPAPDATPAPKADSSALPGGTPHPGGCGCGAH